MSTWWLSYCDGSRPAGTQFLGVTIVQAETFIDAVRLTHELGINPGGEIQGIEFPEGNIQELDPAHFDKLLSMSELEQAGYI